MHNYVPKRLVDCAFEAVCHSNFSSVFDLIGKGSTFEMNFCRTRGELLSKGLPTSTLTGPANQSSWMLAFGELGNYIPIFAAVVVGGQTGSRIGSHCKLPQICIQMATAVLILFIRGRLPLSGRFF